MASVGISSGEGLTLIYVTRGNGCGAGGAAELSDTVSGGASSKRDMIQLPLPDEWEWRRIIGRFRG